MKKLTKKNLIIIITILVIVISCLIFIFTINKPTKKPSEMINQLQEFNVGIPNLIEQNENLLSSIEEKYKQNNLRGSLDDAVELKSAIQQLTDESLKLTELLKNIVTSLSSVDKKSQPIIQEVVQYEISAMNYLVTYSSLKEALTQQIGLEYESKIDNQPIKIKTDVLGTIKQMRELLDNIKKNIDDSSKIIQNI